MNTDNSKSVQSNESQGRSRPKVLRIILAVIGGVVMAVLFALVFGIVAKLLWNWLMPAIFGLPVITYWQAFGIVILAKLLFGSFGHGHHGHSDHIHRRVDQRWHRFLGVSDDEPFHAHPWSRDMKKDWQHFHSFWKEEGKSAFEAYIQRRKADQTESSG